MPYYDYLCKNCNNEFEVELKITDNSAVNCSACGSSSTQRLLSASNFHLKGSGWYKTDYTSSGVSPTASTKNSETTSSCCSGGSCSTKKESSSKPKKEKSKTPVSN